MNHICEKSSEKNASRPYPDDISGFLGTKLRTGKVFMIVVGTPEGAGCCCGAGCVPASA